MPDITDLRTPTPYTFTYTGTGVSDCAATPYTVFDTYVALVDGATYNANMSFTFGAAPVANGQATFSNLIVTNLQPGEIITMVFNTADSESLIS